jgi:hypothetical protein
MNGQQLRDVIDESYARRGVTRGGAIAEIPVRRRRKTQYTVIVNQPGYLPTDDDPFTTTNKKEALSVMAEMATQYREEGYFVVGTAREGYFVAPSEDSTDNCAYVIELHAEVRA